MFLNFFSLYFYSNQNICYDVEHNLLKIKNYLHFTFSLFHWVQNILWERCLRKQKKNAHSFITFMKCYNSLCSLDQDAWKQLAVAGAVFFQVLLIVLEIEFYVLVFSWFFSDSFSYHILWDFKRWFLAWESLPIAHKRFCKAFLWPKTQMLYSLCIIAILRWSIISSSFLRSLNM